MTANAVASGILRVAAGKPTLTLCEHRGLKTAKPIPPVPRIAPGQYGFFISFSTAARDLSGWRS